MFTYVNIRKREKKAIYEFTIKIQKLYSYIKYFISD